MNRKKFVESIEKKLKKRNLSINAFSKEIGYEPKYIKDILYKINKGKKQSLPFDCFIAISSRLDLTINECS